MKIAILIARILFGGMFVFGAIVYFAKINMGPMPKMSPEAMKFSEGIMASGYLMNVIKGFELVFGLAVLFGFYLPLSTVVLFPITLNIFLLHLLIAPYGLGVGIGMMALNLFLAWACRKNYAGLLAPKRIA